MTGPTDHGPYDLWWKNAVVYCRDVETFFDADRDGCGDFEALRRRLDHLSGLGVDCVLSVNELSSREPRCSRSAIGPHAVAVEAGGKRWITRADADEMPQPAGRVGSGRIA